jgi:hypothetical protein
MRDLDEAARALARAVLAEGLGAAEVARQLRAALEAERRDTILECCRAACEDCRRADPQRVEEDGAPYFLHQEPGVDLLVECRSGDIRATLLTS